MTQIKDMPLSLRSDTFGALCSDYDSMLRQLLRGMVETGEKTGTVNIKVKVTLTEDSAPDFTVAGGQQTREITKPKFEHEVSAVIQRKDKRTGSLSGDYELVRDIDGGYVMRPIDDGQCSMFDQDKSSAAGKVIDAEFQELPSGHRALPGAATDGETVDTSEEKEADTGAFVKFEDTPFGWLLQFVGENLRVTEAMGNYTARTESNRVILSSAASTNADFYCPEEKLAPHVGHKVKCAGYGGEEIVTISIECEDCGDILFEISRPNLNEDEEDASNGVDAEEDDESYADGYEYDPPVQDGEEAEKA